MRRIRPTVLLVALALLTAACPRGDDRPGGTSAAPPPPEGGSAWTQWGGNMGRTSSTSEPGPRALPGIAWTNPVAKEVVSEPVFADLAGKPAVLVSSDKEVLAFDLRSGQPIWSSATPSSIVAAPVFAGGFVWAFLQDGLVDQLSPQDGKLVKELELDFTVESSPLLAGDSLVYEETSMSAQVKDSRLHCMDAKTGAERWHRDFKSGTARPASSDGTLVFYSTYDGVHAVKLSDGTPAWDHAFELVVRVFSPIVSGDSLVVGHGGYAPGFLTVLDKATGALRWEKQVPARLSAEPAVTDTEIVIPLMDGKIHRFALKDGASLGTIDPGARCDVRPIVTPTRILAAVGQTVFAFDRATGAPAWNVELESLQVSAEGICAMSVMGPSLLVARLDGNLHALQAPGEK